MFWLDFRSPFWVNFDLSPFLFLGKAFPPSSVLPGYGHSHTMAIVTIMYTFLIGTRAHQSNRTNMRVGLPEDGHENSMQA